MFKVGKVNSKYNRNKFAVGNLSFNNNRGVSTKCSSQMLYEFHKFHRNSLNEALIQSAQFYNSTGACQCMNLHFEIKGSEFSSYQITNLTNLKY